MAQDGDVADDGTTTQPIARLAMLCVDCAAPGELAEFWSAVLGWDVAITGDDHARLTGPSSALGFDRVDGYVPPSWPNDHGAKHFHLDLAVADIEAMARRCIELGATRPGDQPGAPRWVVMLDPAGHPFCLTDEQNW
jgi:predicted enzyme related to lactoylglutathione lyase